MMEEPMKTPGLGKLVHGDHGVWTQVIDRLQKDWRVRAAVPDLR
jgi:hypothetical protein